MVKAERTSPIAVRTAKALFKATRASCNRRKARRTHLLFVRHGPKRDALHRDRVTLESSVAGEVRASSVIANLRREVASEFLLPV